MVELQHLVAPLAEPNDGRHASPRVYRQQLNSINLPIKKQKKMRPRRSKTCVRRRVRVRRKHPDQQTPHLCHPGQQQRDSEPKRLLELERRVLRLGLHQGGITTPLPRADQYRILWTSSERRRLRANRDSECHTLAMEEKKQIRATLRKAIPMNLLRMARHLSRSRIFRVDQMVTRVGRALSFKRRNR